MIAITTLYLLAFGLVTIGGGLYGYFAKASMPSLIAGVVAGALLIAAWWLLQRRAPAPGLILGLVVCLGLAARFVPVFLREMTGSPQIFMAPLAVAGVVLAALSLLLRR